MDANLAESKLENVCAAADDADAIAVELTLQEQGYVFVEEFDLLDPCYFVHGNEYLPNHIF